MQKRRKLLWVCIGFVCVTFIVLGLTINFAFKLKTVDVEFRYRLSQDSTRLEVGVQDLVKEEFVLGENIILMSFDDTISKVEKNIPYLKVNQIIKHFPNIVRVYVSERIPKFKVYDSENNNICYILDEDFKVLNKISYSSEISERLQEELNGIIEIDRETLTISAEVGEFVTSYEIQKDFLNGIVAGVYGRTEDFSIVKSIKVKYSETQKDYNFTLQMKNTAKDDGLGSKIVVNGKENLTEKVFAGISTFEEELSAGTLNNEPSTIITISYKNGEYKGIKN